MSELPEANTEEINEDNDLYFFESDHLALRGNKDYSDMLKAMFILEAQRQQAIEDYNRIIELKKECLENPAACISKLKSNTLDVPPLICIGELPKINWAKFNVKIPEQYIQQINLGSKNNRSKDVKKEKAGSKAWTTEEQRKLEELLVKYPPEDVESSRIKKIAKELGTRTHAQVCSRLQKYYLKLMKVGLPVPGRLPRFKSYMKDKNGKHKGKITYKRYIKPSTFFPVLDIPVAMNELEEAPGPSGIQKLPEESNSNPSNYLLRNYYDETKSSDPVKSDIYLELELVKRIKAEKIVEDSNSTSKFHHFGYKCDFCDEEPITGSRWHCTKCVSNSVDYCTDCILSQLYSNQPHSLNHKFIVVRDDKTILDPLDSESESEVDESSVKNGESGDYSDSEYESSSAVSEIKCESETISFGPSDDDNYSFVVNESCPVNIFEVKKEQLNGDFTETQEVSYNYLHSNLLLDDS